jgi:hypothetical protein
VTPEGRVKAKVDRLLRQFKPRVTWRKPVINGMGEPTLDYVVCANGRYLMIETKADWHDLTPRQKLTRKEFLLAGGKVVAIRHINDDFAFDELAHWLRMVTA